MNALSPLLALDAEATSKRSVGSFPDADLIAACAEFRASEAAYCALYDGPERRSEKQLEAAGKAILGSWDGMLDRMQALQASTIEGLAARAMTLAQHSCKLGCPDPYAFAFDPDDGTVTGRLLDMLLRDGAAMVAGSLISHHPDASLLALRSKFDRLKAEYDRCDTGNVPEKKACRIAKAFDDLCLKIVGMPPAVSSEGRAFQAVAAMHQMIYAAGSVEQIENAEAGSGLWAAWSVLKSIVGVRFPVPCDGARS